METSVLYQLFLQHPKVTTDSRNCPAGSIFFALNGNHFNGNEFAAQALEKGCAYAVIDDKRYKEEGNDRLILVDDCLKALQNLANCHRRTLGVKVIGITGTNGKTTTKELVAAVLSEVHNVLYTQGNLNNHIGVPLTLLQLTNRHDLAVVEMGASHPGEIAQLSHIAEPDFGLITNVGRAHLEGFGSFEGVVKTKGELYDFLRTRRDGTIFINADNNYLTAMADGLLQIKYGTRDDLYINGEMLSADPFLRFKWKAGREGAYTETDTKLIGAYNFENALAAVAVGRFFGVDAKHIKAAIEAYNPSNRRSQLLQTAHNRLIIDAYNANPTSMNAAISNFNKMQAPNKMLILGDMRELGLSSAAEHQHVVDTVAGYGFANVMLVGTQFAGTQNKFICFPNVEALTDELKKHRPEGKTILIKGSNGTHLEKVIPFL